MGCESFTTASDALLSGDLYNAIWCPYNEPMGVVFPLIIFGAIALSLYIYSGSVALPMSVFVILGSVMVTQLPGPATQLVGVVLLLAFSAAAYMFIVRRGPAR